MKTCQLGTTETLLMSEIISFQLVKYLSSSVLLDHGGTKKRMLGICP